MMPNFSKKYVFIIIAAAFVAAAFFGFRAYDSYRENLGFLQDNLREISDRLSKTEKELSFIRFRASEAFLDQEKTFKKQEESLGESRLKISSLEKALSETTKSLELARKESGENIRNLQQASDRIVQNLRAQLSSLESQVSLNKDHSSLPQPLIQSIIGATVYLFCGRDYSQKSYTSASGLNTDSKGLILANAHTIETIDGSPSNCMAVFPDASGRITDDAYHLELKSFVFDNLHDKVTFQITRPAKTNNNPRLSFPVADLRFCNASQINIGDEVTVFGYPAIGGASITLTTGVISGPLEDNFYKTSAKIDKGSSGGVAVLNKDQCYVGIPTWLERNIESIGRIQYWE